MTDTFQLLRVYRIELNGQETFLGKWPFYQGLMWGAKDYLPENVREAIGARISEEAEGKLELDGITYSWRIGAR